VKKLEEVPRHLKRGESELTNMKEGPLRARQSSTVDGQEGIKNKKKEG